MNIEQIIQEMTLEEKAGLCSGKDFWHTKSVERLGIKSIMLTDGPHGLRKQSEAADHLGINASVRATCFPPACATGNSFNTDLMQKMGVALGQECIQENVSVVLGPGLNIKRSPLCGRNFEYFSEDPLLSGSLAAAFVNGVQKNGVAACLKHFAVNSQETARMVNNSVVDERALREIYLKGFEIAVKQSNPQMVMCSYNKINSVYACENEKLLTDILRKEWGFDGVVVTDWGALNNKLDSLSAGLDLEMPSSGGESDELLIEAVKKGRLNEEVLNRSVARILKLVLQNDTVTALYDEEAHHKLAREIAENCAVLLKNEDNILPLNKKDNVCIIGQFAKKLRFQGGGSSKINPTKIDNVCEALTDADVTYSYCDGYDLDDKNVSSTLISEAVYNAAKAERVVIFAGLTDSYESEGFDRSHIELPESQNALIDEVARQNKNTIVVLIHGSVVNMPWLNSVKAVLSMSLPGQAGGSAAVNLLLGKAVPSGRLNETYIDDIKQNPSYLNFAQKYITEYKESVYVGYRYYNTANVKVVFPFGYGLSYSKFNYSDLAFSNSSIDKNGQVKVSVKVTNNGAFNAFEVVQLYIKSPSAIIARPERELKAFKKVFILAGQTATVEFQLSLQDFAYYSTTTNKWQTENGEHIVIIGQNAQEIILSAKIKVKSDDIAIEDIYKNYLGDTAIPLKIADDSFEKICGHQAIKYIVPTKGKYSNLSTLGEIKNTAFGKRLFAETLEGMQKQVGNTFGDDLSNLESMLTDMPLRALAMFSGGEISSTMMEGFVYLLNGKKIKALLKIMQGSKKKKK